MNEREFCYWLQGFSEITGGAAPTPEQWQVIRDHLALVFDKKTPMRAAPKRDTDIMPGITPQPMWPPLDKIPHDPNRWVPPLRTECVAPASGIAAQATC